MDSTSVRICSGAAGVNRLTTAATTKFSSAPTAPMPSGDMPNHQWSALLFWGADEFEVDDVAER